MKYLLNYRKFIFLVVLFSFSDNFWSTTIYEKNIPTFQVTFVGDTGVGKTEIIKKFMGDEFEKFEKYYDPKFIVNFCIKEINIKNQKIKLWLWDLSG